jgi:hypothetical protein
MQPNISGRRRSSLSGSPLALAATPIALAVLLALLLAAALMITLPTPLSANAAALPAVSAVPAGALLDEWQAGQSRAESR